MDRIFDKLLLQNYLSIRPKKLIDILFRKFENLKIQKTMKKTVRIDQLLFSKILDIFVFVEIFANMALFASNIFLTIGKGSPDLSIKSLKIPPTFDM